MLRSAHDVLEKAGRRDRAQDSEPDGAVQWMARERAALVARNEAVHVFAAQHRGQRQATAQAFAERENVRLNAGLLVREQTASATHAGLNLVQDQEHAARGAELAQLSQVASRWNDYATFA